MEERGVGCGHQHCYGMLVTNGNKRKNFSLKKQQFEETFFHTVYMSPSKATIKFIQVNVNKERSR
jgi:hypothetical protein